MPLRSAKIVGAAFAFMFPSRYSKSTPHGTGPSACCGSWSPSRRAIIATRESRQALTDQSTGDALRACDGPVTAARGLDCTRFRGVAARYRDGAQGEARDRTARGSRACAAFRLARARGTLSWPNRSASPTLAARHAERRTSLRRIKDEGPALIAVRVPERVAQVTHQDHRS